MLKAERRGAPEDMVRVGVGGGGGRLQAAQQGPDHPQPLATPVVEYCQPRLRSQGVSSLCESTNFMVRHVQ